MKRYGHVIEEIVTEQNLNDAFFYVLRGSRGKTRTGRYMIEHREEILAEIKQDIEAGTFGPHGFIEFQLKEGGKMRNIQSVCKKDRIALNAIMTIVEKYCNRGLIADTASSIKGRGCHYLSQRMLADMKRDPEGTRYVYKLDIRKYYDSIDQDKAMMIFRSKFKDARLLAILDRCVRMLPKGISIGLRSSQVIGNIYLGYYVDHVMKDVLGVKYYRRYCDDIVIQAGSYRELTRYAKVLRKLVAEAGLEIKSNEQMWDIKDRPVDFLGWQHYSDLHMKVRKRTKKKFARRWKRVKSIRRKVELIGSFYGIAKHADAVHLFRKLTGLNMKSFAEFGFKFEAKDGKKRFDCPLVVMRQLVNMEIVVEDFETDIHTRHGDDKTLVRFTSERLGEGKFITSSEAIRQALEYARSINEIPFKATIVCKDLGNSMKVYLFT